jgi:hypothetical protein
MITIPFNEEDIYGEKIAGWSPDDLKIFPLRLLSPGRKTVQLSGTNILCQVR